MECTLSFSSHSFINQISEMIVKKETSLHVAQLQVLQVHSVLQSVVCCLVWKKEQVTGVPN